MTTIMYRCTGSDGTIIETSSLAEAKEFVNQHGGEYKLFDKHTASTSEGYAKKGPKRRPNSRT